MHPSQYAATNPEKPALILAETGQIISYRELNARSNQAARLFRALGLGVGDVVAVLMENLPAYFEIAWGAQRAGLYFVGIPSQLTPPEVDYILRDSGARLLIASAKTVANVPGTFDLPVYMVGGSSPFSSWGTALSQQPETPIEDERAGTDMLYSSGTTGRPKGVRQPLPEDTRIEAGSPVLEVMKGLGFASDTIFMSPAPLYHSAPLRFSMNVQRLGGTVVLMQRFDPQEALAAIARYRVTESQWVPTHFVRLLKLDPEVRRSYDHSSLRLAIHAAAPCPVPIKQAMIKWWGPILFEFYAGTETNGMTTIHSDDWLAHPGSVGRPAFGIPHICDDNGVELPPRAEGVIWFEGGPEFEYHNDPAKTAESRNNRGWTTIGDIGWLDEDGYLYLTDRKSFMIISGGVNIYPAEIENLLVNHPKVMDVAVIGVPDEDMGEKVIAVVQPVRSELADQSLADELIEWLRPQLSKVKMPRRIDFEEELPRHPTGKLYKRLLRDRYSGKASVTIV